MRLLLASLTLLSAAMTGCAEPADAPAAALPALVKTVPVTTDTGATLGLSGTVRAQTDVPLAFQVEGRIAARAVDAGHQLRRGDLLFALDKRDLEESVRASAADLAVAEAALATASIDLQRHRQLVADHFVSAQALERVELNQREASAQRDVAAARLRQARNALGYGELRAPADGILIDVTGEVGQVVAPGATVAVLAQAGTREVEVYFPEGLTPPATGQAAAGAHSAALTLRETAGAADPQGRTLRARYTLAEPASHFMLGSVVHTRFASSSTAAAVSVPLAAISERGTGPRVWRLRDSRVTSVPVTILSLDGESARIEGALQDGDRLVALGTHLLTENMPVRELTP
jgi:RND family efflux transporter MFP subunit